MITNIMNRKKKMSGIKTIKGKTQNIQEYTAADIPVKIGIISRWKNSDAECHKLGQTQTIFDMSHISN